MEMLSRKISDIVKEDMRLSLFFSGERIDFCCNGFRQLDEVLEEKGEDKEQFSRRLSLFMADLDKKGDRETYFEDMDNVELINLIVNQHHKFTRDVLEELDTYVPMILRAHFDEDPELLLMINRLYGNLRTELLEHLIKEERILFPAMKSGDAEEAKNTIASTEDEHDAAGDILKELRSTTRDFLIPSWSCNTFAAAYHHLEALEQDLFRHIFLENSVLFPRFSQ
ncbi:DUF542 domain-containing protein [Youngiibacter fragilis]|nr:DUF542 domain-containing protein [Youngiibacter fragilis]